jgi:hypothetical protein
MAFAIASYIPFPCVSWWAAVATLDELLLDNAEHFEKMTYRNRYYLSAANGLLTLSIPLQHGREQRTAMSEVRIDNKTRWQMQHWRGITSAYKRTPYFDHYEPSLQQLFLQPFDLLANFNFASIQWLKEQLKLGFNIRGADEYHALYPDVAYDLRKGLKRKPAPAFPAYYQPFRDRIGFLPDLSILDLLFVEGPNALHWIKTNRENIIGR